MVQNIQGGTAPVPLDTKSEFVDGPLGVHAAVVARAGVFCPGNHPIGPIRVPPNPVPDGRHGALDLARTRVREVLAHHQPRPIEPALERELDAYRQMVAARPLEEFYLFEMVEKQDWESL